MKILLVCDTSTNPNLGCQANTAAMYQNILKYQPKADINCVTLRDLLLNKPIQMATRTHRKGKPVNRTSTGISLGSYDHMIINGEGGMGEYGGGRLSAVSSGVFDLIHRAKKSKAKVHMVNYTHNIRSGPNNVTAKHAYGICDSVCVREPLSYDRVRPLHDQVKLFPDLASTHTKPDVERENIIMVGGGTCLKVTPTEVAYAAYERIIKHLMEYKDYQIIVVGWPSMKKGDDEFFNGFMSKYKLPVKHINLTYYQDYIDLCAKSVLNVTGRHHGVVMSFLAGCPMVPIDAKSCKVRGDSWLYGTGDILRLTDGNIEDHLDSYLTQLKRLSERLIRRYQEFQPYLDGHIRHIWNDMNGLLTASIVA